MIRTFAMLCTAALCVTVHAGPSVDRDFFCSLLKIPSITSDIPKVNEAVEFVRSHLAPLSFVDLFGDLSSVEVNSAVLGINRDVAVVVNTLCRIADGCCFLRFV